MGIRKPGIECDAATCFRRLDQLPPRSSHRALQLSVQFSVEGSRPLTTTPLRIMQVVTSKTGQVVIFYNPDEEIDILAGMKAGNTALSRGYNTIFADHLFDSNYSLYAAVYSADPAQAHPWMARADALRMDSLLIDKLSFGIEAPGPTYLFNWGGLRGIRFGDAAHGRPGGVPRLRQSRPAIPLRVHYPGRPTYAHGPK